MVGRITGAVDPLERWAIANGTRETEVHKRLRDATAPLPMSQMQIGPDQGQVLHFLARLIGARNAIEIGTFTGYSALWVAAALPPEGRLVACDVSAEWTGIGRAFWAEAGVADRIDLRLAPALETLAALERSDGRGSFDFAFIDADKEAYPDYYEACLRLVRPGGLIALDNTIQGGRVADEKDETPAVRVMRDLGRHIKEDPRVEMCLLMIGDGVTVVSPR